MKKLLLEIIVLTMTSCKLEVKGFDNVESLNFCPFNEITKFKFEGHEYIEFGCSWSAKRHEVVHDPECKKCNIRKSSIR